MHLQVKIILGFLCILTELNDCYICNCCSKAVIL